MHPGAAIWRRRARRQRAFPTRFFCLVAQRGPSSWTRDRPLKIFARAQRLFWRSKIGFCHSAHEKGRRLGRPGPAPINSSNIVGNPEKYFYASGTPGCAPATHGRSERRRLTRKKEKKGPDSSSTQRGAAAPRRVAREPSKTRSAIKVNLWCVVLARAPRDTGRCFHDRASNHEPGQKR